MNKSIASIFIFWVSVIVTSNSYSHSRWVVSSHTILSGDKPEYISLDFSISNDIFHPDMAYGGKDIAGLHDKSTKDAKQKVRNDIMKQLASTTRVAVTLPNGSVEESATLVDLGRKSSATVLLKDSGTYRVAIRQDPILFTVYETPLGERAREFGSKKEVRTLLPEGAKNIKTLRVNSRVETFVTRNGLSRVPLRVMGKGLELKFVTHPNELFVGESAKFQILLNGKALGKDQEIKLTRSGTRYRNQRNVIKLKSDKDGYFIVLWPEPGMYLLESDLKRASSDENVDMEIYSLYLTLEVNPE